MIALLLAFGCPKSPHYVLFSEPPPRVQRTDPVPLPEVTDNCPDPVPLLPDHRAPYVVLQGDVPVATCRAQVVPEPLIWDLSQQADQAEIWDQAAHVCYEGRDRDRDYAQERFDSCVADRTTLRRETHMLRTMGLLGTGAGLLVGLAVGYGYASILLNP